MILDFKSDLAKELMHLLRKNRSVFMYLEFKSWLRLWYYGRSV